MSKKTVFMLDLFVKRQQLITLVDAIFLADIEEAADGGGQSLDAVGGVLARCAGGGQRLNQFAAQHHGTKQSLRLRLVAAAAQAFPGAPDDVVRSESKHLLRAGKSMFILAELRREPSVQFHQLVDHAKLGRIRGWCENRAASE